MTPARGQLRAARGLSLAAACVTLSVAAHAVAGGGLPGGGPFVFCALLVAVAAVALADRRRTVGEIFAVVFATQPVLHLMLSMSAHGPASITPSTSMVAAHAAAATVLAALLAGGEALVWSFTTLTETMLLRAVRTVLAWAPVASPLGHAGRAFAHHLGRPTWRSLRWAPRRGPPVLCCR